MKLLTNLFQSSLGKKFIMAVTGLGLFLFVIGHMVGNLQIFLGAELLNSYGHFLQSSPEILWPARIGLLAMVAHNILRWCAIIEKPHKPHFSKKLRRRFIYIPGKIIKHARQLCVKVPERFFKEVNRLREGWQLPLHPAPAWATG